MYTLDCTYYTKSFATIDGLINDIMISGMDPNYPIMLNGEPTELTQNEQQIVAEWKSASPPRSNDKN